MSGGVCAPVAAACPGQGLPGRQVPVGSITRDTGHGRIETRTLKTAHVSRMDFPDARQAIKICRLRQDDGTGRASRQTAYAITSLTSADATTQDMAPPCPRALLHRGAPPRTSAT
jgi:hypothetical protein